MANRLPLIERFLSYVDKSVGDCWIWRGARQSRNRYGTFGIGGKILLSHRVSYELHCGEIPKGMHVLHKCDVPYCVNPAHLFLGTHQDNMADKECKGRGNQPKGERHGNAKLTEENVRSIRASSETLKTLAVRYGVTFGLISHIKRGRAWTHIH